MSSKDHMEFASMLGPVRLDGTLGSWRVAACNQMVEPGLESIRFTFSAPEPAGPPQVVLSWAVPQRDMQVRWHPGARFNRFIPADWAGSVDSNLACSAPVMQLGNIAGKNRLLFAVSDAIRLVKIKAGICEETCELACSVELFAIPEAPLTEYEITLRLDSRDIFYADAIRAAFAWFERLPEYAPMATPDEVFDPIYSSWYSYHQDLFDHQLEAECEEACRYGIKGIIVDDGWQTEDNNRGYAFCGDWEIAKKRFPDMRRHVAAVQRLGMKYMLWYSVPFVGSKSGNLARFEGKYLNEIKRLEAWVLDPRFPDVREFLISIYETALREWNLDGFKLDFIDRFQFEGEDPAIREDYAGRDIKSLPAAVDTLLAEMSARLRRIKPEIMIEFRQRYIGPAVRKYGNMLRSGDCPGDVLSNRINIIDLRLTSGSTAVHADMLEWNPLDTAESAALQLLNVIFSVPQISMRLKELPESHARMLRFWLDFWTCHRDVLMKGELKAFHPEMNYPVVVAENERERVIAVYSSGQAVAVDGTPGQTVHVINAGGVPELVLELGGKPLSTQRFAVTGEMVAGPDVGCGLLKTAVPCAGLLTLRF